MGERRGLGVYPSPKPYYDVRYLLDLIWRDEQDGSCRRGVLELAAEVEWGKLEDIRYDFEQLILLKSPLKLMVCDAWMGKESKQLLPTLAKSRVVRRPQSRGNVFGFRNGLEQTSAPT
jgi:hypothetical protein